MKRSGGFAIVEMLIVSLVIAILVLGSYYFVKKRNHHPVNNPQTSVIANVQAVSPPSQTMPTPENSVLSISEFGIKLVGVPTAINDLTYAYYPANTAANFKQAIFTTGSLSAKSPQCSIGELDKYPGKYNASSYQGSATFVKQFKGFWIAEVDEGVPCKGSQSILDLQNSQINTFKQYVTNPDNLQVLN